MLYFAFALSEIFAWISYSCKGEVSLTVLWIKEPIFNKTETYPPISNCAEGERGERPCYSCSIILNQSNLLFVKF
jgi:hypothetical protein